MKNVDDIPEAEISQMRLALPKKQSLRFPTDENQRLRTERGRMEAQFALAQQEKRELLHQQACMAQHALKMIRNEAYLFRDKMLVDAKTLCQYHVNKLKEMNTHYQSQ
eukprot:4240923-Amphidinium_carterae.1